MDHSHNAAEIFNKRATEYQQKFMDVSLYHDTLDIFCANLKMQNAKILDIACGPGNISQYILSKRADFEIIGIDLSSNMIELAQTNNPKARFAVMDCRQIGALQERFDGIILGFVMPYLSSEECKQIISDASTLLKPDGVLYLSTMIENEDSKSGFVTSSYGDVMYMNYHKSENIERALIETGFIIIHSKKQPYPAQGKVTDLILIAKKQNDNYTKKRGNRIMAAPSN